MLEGVTLPNSLEVRLWMDPQEDGSFLYSVVVTTSSGAVVRKYSDTWKKYVTAHQAFQQYTIRPRPTPGVAEWWLGNASYGEYETKGHREAGVYWGPIKAATLADVLNDLRS